MPLFSLKGLYSSRRLLNTDFVVLNTCKDTSLEHSVLRGSTVVAISEVRMTITLISLMKGN